MSSFFVKSKVKTGMLEHWPNTMSIRRSMGTDNAVHREQKLSDKGGMWHPTDQMEEVVVHRIQ